MGKQVSDVKPDEAALGRRAFYCLAERCEDIRKDVADAKAKCKTAHVDIFDEPHERGGTAGWRTLAHGVKECNLIVSGASEKELEAIRAFLISERGYIPI
jgi:hypothetical protein